MPFLGHVAELRGRLLRIFAAIVLAGGVSLYFAPVLLKVLVQPYNGLLMVIAPTEGFSIYLRVALTAGAILAMPYIIVEAWRFVSPALHPRERRMAYGVIPAAVVLFACGSAFAWFVMIPVAVRFLSGFLPEVFRAQWTSERYYGFVTSLLFWVGICFEMPLVIFVLARLRLVTTRLLLRGWRVAIVAIVAVSAIITPTVDAFNMMLVALPLIALFLLSILLAGFAQRS